MESVQVIVLGTGLGESLLAAALAKEGLKVLHLDDQVFYGRHHCVLNGNQILSSSLSPQLTLNMHLSLGKPSSSVRVHDLMDWIQSLPQDLSKSLLSQHVKSTESLESLSQTNLQKLSPLYSLSKASRHYNLELSPKLFYARGPLVELMIASSVGSYVEFRGLENIYILLDQEFEQVPGTKEDVFTNERISLPEKRRLMKFITQAAAGQLPGMRFHPCSLVDQGDKSFDDFLKEHHLSPHSMSMIKHAIALLDMDSKGAVNTWLLKATATNANDALESTKLHLSSLGRYCKTGFLAGIYGGGSELAQGFCRLCGVHGGTYRLDYHVSSLEVPENGEEIILHGVDGSKYACKWLVASTDFGHLSPQTRFEIETIRRAIIIRDSPIQGSGINLFVIPPGKVGASGIYGIQMNSDTQSCPDGQYILYLFGKVSQDEMDQVIQKMCSNPDGEPDYRVCLTYEQKIQIPTTHDRILWCPGPDSAVDTESIVDQAKAHFAKICPEGTFLSDKTPDPSESIDTSHTD